jgi:hypothetical protein
MSTSWSVSPPLARLRHPVTGAVERGEAEPITARPVLVEVINLNGQHVYKVTTNEGYLVGKGYFPTTDTVKTAVESIGYTMADIHIKSKERTA